MKLNWSQSSTKVESFIQSVVQPQSLVNSCSLTSIQEVTQHPFTLDSFTRLYCPWDIGNHDSCLIEVSSCFSTLIIKYARNFVIVVFCFQVRISCRSDCPVTNYVAKHELLILFQFLCAGIIGMHHYMHFMQYWGLDPELHAG